jgi:hypothetical protein
VVIEICIKYPGGPTRKRGTNFFKVLLDPGVGFTTAHAPQAPVASTAQSGHRSALPSPSVLAILDFGERYDTNLFLAEGRATWELSR